MVMDVSGGGGGGSWNITSSADVLTAHAASCEGGGLWLSVLRRVCVCVWRGVACVEH